MRILFKNAIKTQKFWELAMCPWSMTASKAEGRLLQKSYHLNWKKINTNIVCSHQCGILTLFNISLCSNLSEGKKKVFHFGKLTQNMSQPKERARKVQLHEEKTPIFPVSSVLEYIKRSLDGARKWFSSVLHHVLAKYTAQTVEWIPSLFDVLFPCEEPCIHHCLMQNTII